MSIQTRVLPWASAAGAMVLVAGTIAGQAGAGAAAVPTAAPAASPAVNSNGVPLSVATFASSGLVNVMDTPVGLTCRPFAMFTALPV